MGEGQLALGGAGELGVSPVLPALALAVSDVIHRADRDLDGIEAVDTGGDHAHDLGTAPVLVQHQSGDGPTLGLRVFRRESHAGIVPLEAADPASGELTLSQRLRAHCA
jgi:hypothetical protein